MGDDLPFGSRGGIGIRHYFPVVSDAWVEGDPVTVLATTMRDDLRESPSTGRFEGILSRNDLPGMARARFAEAPGLSPEHWVIDLDNAPEDQKALGTALLGFGALATAALAIGVLVQRARGRGVRRGLAHVHGNSA